MKPKPPISVEQSLCSGGIFDWDRAVYRLDELNAKVEEPDFWTNAAKAQTLMKERTHLAGAIGATRKLEGELDDALTLVELADAEGDAPTLEEGRTQLNRLQARAKQLELESLLSGEADGNDCFLEIHAGAGGTEAQDWAEMLARMYTRWAESKGYKVEYLEESAGDGAGIKSATFRISGNNAYGWMKTESGVHRLVRISPFDSNARRHTSFSSVWIYPVVDENINIVINEKDCRIDTYRASGAGGQHINKTDSAVRITHIPTNIAVACQNERSQHQNRAKAWEMLKARLYELELKKREEKANAQEAAKTDIGWGHQIRSYVMQPYKMVKDLRTEMETSDTAGVLDGDLDKFMAASLAARLKTAADVTA